MTPDDKALQDLFDTVHYSVELVDTSPDEDEDDPDDDEKYEPSEIAKLAMMDEDEYAKHIAEYMKRYRESNNK